MTRFTVNSPILSKAATLAAAIMLALASARTTNLWLQQQYPPPESGVKTTTQSASKPNNRKISYNQLVKLHLFGEVAKKGSATPKKNIIKAPETSLKLQLIGVIFDRDTDEGIAIISESKKPQKTYRKEDQLPGGATLYAIEQERVILKRNGRHETLSLKKHNLYPTKGAPAKLSPNPTPKFRQKPRLPPRT